MASELPRFLQRISMGKFGLGREISPSDSPPSPSVPQDFQAESGLLATELQKPLKAKPTPTPGIFRSRPPVLLTEESPKAPSEALDRARSPELTERVSRKARIAKARSDKAEARARGKSAPSELPAPQPEFRIVSLPRLAQGGKWRTEAMRSYSVPLLIWFTRGQGRITLAGVTRGFGPHNCIYLPPGTMHGFEVTSQVFGSAVFFPTGTDLGLPEEPVHLRFRDGAGHNELTQMIDAMQRELEGNRPARDRALQHHAGLLSVWLERQVESQNGAAALTETGARRLSAAYSALVEKRFREGLSVADFAAELGVTPTHLTRSCNTACGHSAHEILSDRIFYEARKRLAEDKVPVSEIARDLGFTSAAYFTRAFQKATGQTPTAFRAKSAN